MPPERKAFLFEYDGTPDAGAAICLAMYDSDNPLVSGKDPTIRFDNKNTLSNNRLKLTSSEVRGDVNADGAFNIADAVLLQNWLLTVPDAKLKNWKAGDLYDDNRLDVFDLTLMKRMLVK